MSEEKKAFTVNDRRLFTPDGELRQPARDDVAPPKQAPEPARERREPARPAGRPGAGEAPVEFAGFLLSLAAQAAQLLEAGDVRASRSLVGILEMLKDKTEGRRTAEEDRVLEGVLYELRMGHVSRSGAGGA
jgi:hypothetical protein